MDNAVDWTSIDLLISQLTGLLDAQNDGECVEEGMKQLSNKINGFHHKEETKRSLLKELQNEAEEQEQSTELTSTIEEQKQQLNILIKEKEEAGKRLEVAKNDVFKDEEKVKKAEEEYLEMVSKCNQAKLEANATKTRVKNVFLLYHELTKIKWDYDSPLIKGVMTRTKFNDVIDFEIDPANKSDYDISNTLWDLMEGEEDKVII